jgi:Iron-dependent Transcriptional regulator
MRVSARADYALRAAIELAAASGSHVTGEQLARAQNIPGKFIETILTQLRRTGLVRASAGRTAASGSPGPPPRSPWPTLSGPSTASSPARAASPRRT